MICSSSIDTVFWPYLAIVSLPDPAFMKDKGLALHPKYWACWLSITRNLENQSDCLYWSRGKNHSESWLDEILWAYDSPKEVSSNTGLQQSRHCTCDTANFPWHPALLSAPDPTHYREYIYYHMTTSYQPSQEAQDFGRSAPDPYPSWRRGLGTRLIWLQRGGNGF